MTIALWHDAEIKQHLLALIKHYKTAALEIVEERTPIKYREIDFLIGQLEVRLHSDYPLPEQLYRLLKYNLDFTANMVYPGRNNSHINTLILYSRPTELFLEFKADTPTLKKESAFKFFEGLFSNVRYYFNLLKITRRYLNYPDIQTFESLEHPLETGDLLDPSLKMQFSREDALTLLKIRNHLKNGRDISNFRWEIEIIYSKVEHDFEELGTSQQLPQFPTTAESLYDFSLQISKIYLNHFFSETSLTDCASGENLFGCALHMLNGTDVNVLENRRTPLMKAAGNEDLRMMELFIENGANPNLIDKLNLTALHHFITKEFRKKIGGTEKQWKSSRNDNFRRVLSLFVNNGFNIRFRLPVKNTYNIPTTYLNEHSILEICQTHYKDDAVIQAALDLGADVFSRDSQKKPFSQGESKYLNNHIESIAIALLKLKRTIRARRQIFSFSEMIYLLKILSPTGEPTDLTEHSTPNEIINRIISFANKRISDLPYDIKKLDTAAEEGDMEACLMYLLENEYSQEYILSAIILALKNLHFTIVKILLISIVPLTENFNIDDDFIIKLGSELLKKNPLAQAELDKALIKAIKLKNLEKVKFFVNLGANVIQPNSFHQTNMVCHEALSNILDSYNRDNDAYQICHFLFKEKGLDINAIRPSFNNTYLHYVASFYTTQIPEMLALGADPRILDGDGQTPAMLARANRHNDTAALLELTEWMLDHPISEVVKKYLPDPYIKKSYGPI